MVRGHANWLVLPVALLSVVACQKKEKGMEPTTTATPPAVQTPPQTTPTTTATAANTAESRHWGRHRAGITGMVLAAAKDLELKPEQKTKVEQLEKELHDGMMGGGMHAAGREHEKGGAMPGQAKGGAMPGAEQGGPMHGAAAGIHATIVEGIKAGSIDRAKLEPQFKALEQAEQEKTQKQAKTLNELHATLDANQRKAAAEVVRAKLAKQSERFEAKKAQSKEMGADPSKRRLERLTQKLDLDAAQQKKVDQLLAKHAPEVKDSEMQAHKKKDAVLSDFEKDSFDATKVELSGMNPKKGMERMTQFLSELLPILKPEQRQKLATQMEQHRGFGGGGRYEGMQLDPDLQIFIGEEADEGESS